MIFAGFRRDQFLEIASGCVWIRMARGGVGEQFPSLISDIIAVPKRNVFRRQAIVR